MLVSTSGSQSGCYFDPLWLHGIVWGDFDCHCLGGRALTCLDSLPPYTPAMKKDYPAQDTNRQETLVWNVIWAVPWAALPWPSGLWSVIPSSCSKFPGQSAVTRQRLITKDLGQHCHYYHWVFKSTNLILLNTTEASAEFPCAFLPWQNTVQIVSTLYLFVNPIDLVISILGRSEMRDSKQSR